MTQTPEQRLSMITRHRLRLEAGPLDDALVRFTRAERRVELPQHLFMLSIRSISLDGLDAVDGYSPSKNRLGRVLTQVNKYRGPSHRFTVEDSVKVVNGEKQDQGEPPLALDFTVRFGAQAMAGLLKPDHYVRSQTELSVAQELGRTLKPSTVPVDELETDHVRFRYRVPHPARSPEKQIEYLHAILAEGVKLQDLNLVEETRFMYPQSTLPAPERTKKLLKGREQYPKGIRSLSPEDVAIDVSTELSEAS